MKTRLVPGPRSSSRRALAVLVAALATVLVACSSGSDMAESSGTSDDAAGGQAAAESAAQDSAAALSTDAVTQNGRGQGSPALLELEPGAFTGRDVIRTASMSIVAKDLAGARVEVSALMTRFGGVIASESTTSDPAPKGEDVVRQTMQLGLQVPTARFDATLAALDELGTVRERSIQTEDVTAAVADIDSRVESARAALERVRALLTRADTLGTVIRLEGVLSDRQADLESLVAQQRALAGQTELATIQLGLRTPAPDDTAPAEEEDVSGFVDGLAAGWGAMKTFVVAVGTTVGVLLPFAILFGLLAVPALLWYRRRGTGPLRTEPVSPPAT